MQHYLDRFKKLLNLPEDGPALLLTKHTWIRCVLDPTGSLALQRGVPDEGIHDIIVWNKRGKIVFVDGWPPCLAALVFIARRIKLPTDHPLLSEAACTAQYNEMWKAKELILKSRDEILDERLQEMGLPPIRR